MATTLSSRGRVAHRKHASAAGDLESSRPFAKPSARRHVGHVETASREYSDGRARLRDGHVRNRGAEHPRVAMPLVAAKRPEQQSLAGRLDEPDVSADGERRPRVLHGVRLPRRHQWRTRARRGRWREGGGAETPQPGKRGTILRLRASPSYAFEQAGARQLLVGSDEIQAVDQRKQTDRLAVLNAHRQEPVFVRPVAANHGGLPFQRGVCRLEVCGREDGDRPRASPRRPVHVGDEVPPGLEVPRLNARAVALGLELPCDPLRPRPVSSGVADEEVDLLSRGTVDHTAYPRLRHRGPQAEQQRAEVGLVIDAIHRRRNIRHGFSDQPVPDPVIDDIVQCALVSPSSKNAQPWRLHVVTDTAILTELADAVQSARHAERYRTCGSPRPSGVWRGSSWGTS